MNSICHILDEKIPIRSNQAILKLKSDIKKYKDLVIFVEDRAGHDKRYAIDATKLESELGWSAEENFESGIIKTIEWYLDKYNS